VMSHAHIYRGADRKAVSARSGFRQGVMDVAERTSTASPGWPAPSPAPGPAPPPHPHR
jgi:hypothetical protein